jgi:hypothetical protein
MTRSVLDDLGEEITGIVAPVSICMALVVVLVKALNPDGMADSSSVAIATIAYHEKVSCWELGLCMAGNHLDHLLVGHGAVVLFEQAFQLPSLPATASGCTQQHIAHMVQRISRHQAVRAVKALRMSVSSWLCHSSDKQSCGKPVCTALFGCCLCLIMLH